MRRNDLWDLNEALQHPGKKVAVDIVTELAEEADIDLLKPIEGYLEAVSTGNLLLLTGEFKTKCVVECARCGGPLEIELDFKMEEQFPVEGVPSIYSHDDYARVVAEEDYPLFDDNNLIVEALIRQGLLTETPLQPLCQFGWDGPCPEAAKRLAAKALKEQSHPLGKLSELLQPEEDAE
ncbi:MAG: DUF177 domain-containing protein [Armatimonadetes bacterium]|nr:DUF177 domain-containing protein [Armatimonadota bacterium]